VSATKRTRSYDIASGGRLRFTRACPRKTTHNRRMDMRLFGIVAVTALAAFVMLSPVASEAEWRGAERDGIYRGEELLESWPDTGPKLLWAAEGIGEGFSSPTVAGDRVYTTGMVDGTGYLTAFDLDGKQLWQSAYGPEWAKDYPGARTTPTVVADRIYLVSAYGVVVCLDAAGKVAWSADLVAEFGLQSVRWGITESLLVDGDVVYCTPGGPDAGVVALDRHTGKTVWKAKGNGESSAYCSPRLLTHGGRRLVVTMTRSSIVGVDADTGEGLWRHDHVTKYDINPNTPLFHDGQLLSFSGYGTGAQKLELNSDGTAVEKIWSQPKLDSQMGSAVLIDGFLYGSGHNNRGWHCVDWETGEVEYTANVLGRKGNIAYADGLAYCYSEKGDVGLVRLSPDAFEVVSSFKVVRGSGQHWAHPVVRNGRLYVRHGSVLMVHDISAE